MFDASPNVSADSNLLVGAGLVWAGLVIFVILLVATEVGFRIAIRHHRAGA